MYNGLEIGFGDDTNPGFRPFCLDELGPGFLPVFFVLFYFVFSCAFIFYLCRGLLTIFLDLDI